jgi:hypothetical protein
MEDLIKKVSADLQACLTVGADPPTDPYLRNVFYDPRTPSCRSCYMGCFDVYVLCLACAALVAIFGPLAIPACIIAKGQKITTELVEDIVAAIAEGCLPAELGCQAICFIPGNGCCQTPCALFSYCDDSGDSCCGSDFCCGSDEVCTGPGRNQCCPKDNPVGCGSSELICCALGYSCCPLTTTCCSPNAVCLASGACCPTAQFCDGACCKEYAPCQTPPSGRHICCTAGALCGEQCCPPGAICSNGQCAFGQPCGNTFCDIASVCLNGSCCPRTQACLNKCCPSGQFCQKPGTGACGLCPGGMQSVNCSPSATQACCPPGVHCCNGQCCPSAGDQFGPIVCCSPVQADKLPFDNSQFGCHHLFAAPNKVYPCWA